ncbi:type I secretion C-terminal target domain (VC_A0849 subclass) [Marinobacter sp. es.042]|uniref:Ig-like domain-containing protein n=1 Tax=Marinobacter sp. es.042 TaxID=1761794 RepID=UPI000B512D5E|nr:VCBS domain-containing protein [Marinobacter sp. es.042]SNB59111.1 type I secretion C-terminal target domain (VC_A0849 subclass) [Marinobacter sp. es.042]
MSITIAIVLNVSGKVWAEAPDGSRRLLEQGDALMLGERLITAEDGRVLLDFGYNNTATVDSGVTILASAELASNFVPSPNEDSIVEDESVAQALAAIEEALGTSIEEAEAPAAGLEGGSAGGSSSVRLARILENINPSDISLDLTTVQADTPVVDIDGGSGLNPTAPEPGTLSIESVSGGTSDTPAYTINGSGNNLANGESITVTITDQNGTTVSQVINPGPDGSYTAVISQLTRLVDGPITIDASATAANGERLTASTGGTLDVTTGMLDVTAQSIDNDAQTIDLTGTTTDVAEGNAVELTITDTQGTVVTATATVGADGSFSIAGVDLSGLVDGSLTIEASAQDRNGNNVTDRTSGTFNAVDDVPVISGDITGNVTEDEATILTTTGTLAANGGDPGEDAFTGETLAGTYGELVIDENGTWTYSADNSQQAIQGLATDQTLTDSFTVTNADGVTTETVTITINSAQDAPVANDDAPLTTDEDTVLSNIDVLGNDTDSDGDSLSVTQATATNGTVIINADGTLDYIPNANFAGNDTIAYTVSDGNGGTDSASVAVTVNPVDDQSSLSLTDGAATEDSTSAGAVIGEITLTDEEFNATVDFTAGTNDDGYYEIVGNEVRLTSAGETYLDAGNALPDVSLTTNDGVTVSNTVTTTLVNDTSTLSLTNGSVTEDSTSAGDVIGEITLTDEEGNATVDFTAGTNDNGYYEIVGNEVRLTSAGEAYLDAGNALPDVSLTTNDGVTATNTVTTTLVNDQASLSLTDGVATEDSTSAGDVIGEITLTDEEGNATVDFTAGTNDDGYYEIVGNEVRLTSAGEAYLDAGNELPDVSLTTNDGVTVSNTVTTTLVNDQSSLSLTDGSATEDSTSAGAVISEITLTDEEGNATVDFTAGTNDDGYYEIVGNEVRLTSAGETYLDAGNALPDVSLTTNDGVTATNTVTTTLVNDQSSLTLTDGVATEDSTSAGAVISEITLTDEEGNATVDFTAGTNDDGYYEIVGNEVRLTSAGETYLDAGNALPNVSLTTNDGVIATNTVTTTLVNDISTLSLTDGTATEDATSAGDVIGEITLTDEEGNATVDFTAGTNDDGYYEIVGNEVRLTSAGETYLDAGNALPDVSLTTNDGVIATNTVTTTLVNDQSSLTLTDGTATEDSTSAGAVISEITLTDEEGNATVDFTAGTNDAGYYEIVGNEVRLTSAGETYLDAGNTLPNVSLTTNDGVTATNTVTTTLANDTSTLSLTDGSATEDTTSAGDVIGEITLTDEEGNATVNFTAGTNDDGYYEIVGNEVRLTSAGETYLDAGNALPDVSLTTNDGVTVSNTVTTTLVNDTSTLSLTDGTATEDSTSAGAVISEITLTDEEGNATVDFTAGTNDDGYYEIVGNNVVLTADGEAYLDAGNPLPDVSLTTNDGVTATNTVTTRLVNDTSTLSLTDGTAAEDTTSAGDVISEITLTDEEGNATVDFTAGTNDDGYYEIVGNEVRLTSAGETYLDAGNALPDVSLTTNDGVTATNIVTTTLVNDQSSLSLTDGSVTEDSTSAGAVIGEITLTDEEGNATVDFTAGTNDNGYYEIVGNEVRLTSAGETYLDAGNTLPNVSLTTNDGVTATNTVTTTLVNDAPVANDDAALTTDEDTVLSNIDVLGNDTDSDGDTLSVTQATATNGMVIINADGTLDYTPNTNFAGDDTIIYTVSDGNGGTDSASVAITVNPVADPADITVQATDSAVTEDDANDNTASGTVNVSDADSGEGTLSSATANYGSPTVDGSGNWTYTLDNTNTTVQALKAGETLTDTITFTSDDGTTATQDITINGTDDVPLISGDTTGAVTEDDANTLTVTGALAATGGDAGEDVFTAETLTGTYGELVIGENGTWTYSADNSQQAIQELAEGDALTDTITVTNADGVTTQEVTITLNGANDDPVATDDTYVFSTIPGLFGEYFAYQQGTDGSNLTNVAQVKNFIAATQADATFIGTSIDYGLIGGGLGSDGKLQNFLKTDSNSLSKDPDNSSDAIIRMTGNLELEAGTYQFRVRADDGYRIEVNGQTVAEFNGNQGATTRSGSEFTLSGDGPHSVEIVYWDQAGGAQLRIEIREQGGQYQTFGVQHVSHTGPDSALIVDENQSLEISPATLLENDVDEDGDTLVIQSVQDATNGTVALNGSGNIVFTPDDNFSGDASFSYTVSDGQGGTDTATVTVDVKPVADAPTLTAIDATSVQAGVTTISTGSPDEPVEPDAFNSGAGVDRQYLEIELGLPNNFLNNRFDPDGDQVTDPGNVTVVDGKITGSSQALTAGMDITWDYTFTNGEDFANEVSLGYNDLVVLVVTAPSGARETLLVDSSENKFPNQAVEGTFTYTATESGHHQFQWLVLNGGDGNKDSWLSLTTPTVTAPGLAGNYGMPVDLVINAALADQDGSETLGIVIDGMPAGAALTAGVQNPDGTWSLGASDLNDLQLLPPAEFSGDIALTITATATESGNNDEQSVTDTLTVTVDRTEETVSGDQQGNNLQGAATDDLVRGYAGDDTLSGGAGNDYLIGGAGNDTLIGGADGDVLTGGVGADVFRWELGDANDGQLTQDRVTDFTIDTQDGYNGSGQGDQLELTDLLQDASSATINDYMMAREEHGDTVLYLNKDGALSDSGDNAHQSITLSGVSMDGQTSDQFIDSLLSNNQIKIE